MITGKYNNNDCFLTISNTDGFSLRDVKSDVVQMPSACMTISGSFNINDRYATEVEIVDQNHENARETVKASVSMFNSDRMPDKVIFNGDTTILIDGDDKYVVKCGNGDTFDPVFGFLYGYFLMNNRMSKTQAAKFFKHLEKCAVDDMPKVKRVENIVDDKSLTLDEYEKMMREVLEEFIA